MTEAFIKSCVPCQAVTKSSQRDPIISSPLPDYPFQSIDVDFTGPLPNRKYVFIAVDEYSRYPVIEIVNSTSFSQLKPVLENLFATFGFPESLKFDHLLMVLNLQTF